MEISNTPIIRRRSSSFKAFSRREIPPRLERNKKSLSSGNLYLYESKLLDSIQDIDIPNLLCYWREDKVKKNDLGALKKLNLRNINNSTVKKVFHMFKVYFVFSQYKIEAEYELYLLKDYEKHLEDLAQQSEEMKPKIQQFLEIDDNNTGAGRRKSEPMILFAVQKGQPLSQIFPVENESMEYREMVDIISILKVNSSNEYKGHDELMITSMRLIVFHKKRLYRVNFYKHLCCRFCDSNNSSCLQLIPPIGDEVIIRFKSIHDCKKYHEIINDLIQRDISLNKLTDEVTEVQIYKDTHSTNEPLKSKNFPCTKSTMCIDLKTAASKEFGIFDLAIAELCLKVKLSNKQHIVSDYIPIVNLMDHLQNINDGPDCIYYCCDKEKVPTKFKFYLVRSSTSSQNDTKKKLFRLDKIDFSYNLYQRWPSEELPDWLMTLLSHLYFDSVEVEGVFRINGNNAQIENFVQTLSVSDDYVVDEHMKINTKAAIIKRFLNHIEYTLLYLREKSEYDTLCNIIKDKTEATELKHEILSVFNQLPSRNQFLLKHLLMVLRHCCDNKDTTKMEISSMSICIAQSLFGHYSNSDISNIQTRYKFTEALLQATFDIITEETRKSIIDSFEKYHSDLSASTCSSSSAQSRIQYLNSSTDDSKSKTPNNINPPIVPPRTKRKNDLKSSNNLSENLSPSEQLTTEEKRHSFYQNEQSKSTDETDFYGDSNLNFDTSQCPLRRQANIKKHRKHDHKTDSAIVKEPKQIMTDEECSNISTTYNDSDPISLKINNNNNTPNSPSRHSDIFLEEKFKPLSIELKRESSPTENSATNESLNQKKKSDRKIKEAFDKNKDVTII